MRAPSRHRHPYQQPCRGLPSHVPRDSRRLGSRRLYAGHRLASKRVSARLILGPLVRPSFDAIYRSFDTSTAKSVRSPSQSPPDALSPCAFSSSLTTPGIQPDAARGGLKPPPRRATPEGQQSPICHAAPQQARSPTSSTFPPALVAQTRSSPEPNYVSADRWRHWRQRP